MFFLICKECQICGGKVLGSEEFCTLETTDTASYKMETIKILSFEYGNIRQVNVICGVCRERGKKRESQIIILLHYYYY
jgi:hypothetical protein